MCSSSRKDPPGLRTLSISATTLPWSCTEHGTRVVTTVSMELSGTEAKKSSAEALTKSSSLFELLLPFLSETKHRAKSYDWNGDGCIYLPSFCFSCRGSFKTLVRILREQCSESN